MVILSASLQASTLNRMPVSHDDVDAVARKMHEQLASLSPDSPWRDVPWTGLPEEVREENRAQVRGVAAHLRKLGLSVEPSADGDVEDATLTDDELERAAVLEHERWVERRQSAGWAYGAERDDEALAHPGLVPWHELTEGLRDLDRVRVRMSVEVARRLGYSVRR